MIRRSSKIISHLPCVEGVTGALRRPLFRQMLKVHILLIDKIVQLCRNDTVTKR